MSVKSKTSHDQTTLVSVILLSLCLLTLIVSLVGLYRTSVITNARVVDLQSSWELVMHDGAQGNELLATNNLMQGIIRPVPAVQSAAGWSLAMAILTVLLFAWYLITSYRANRHPNVGVQNTGSNSEIDRILDEIAPLASGDLDVRASATEGSAGALADALNSTVLRLQKSTALQLDASGTLRQAADDSQTLSAMLEEKCVNQTEDISSASSLLSAMNRTAEELLIKATESAKACSLVGKQAQMTSLELKQAIHRLSGMKGNLRASRDTLNSLEAHTGGIETCLATACGLTQRLEIIAVNMTLGSQSAVNQVNDVGISSMAVTKDRVTDDLLQLAQQLEHATRDIRSLISSASTDVSCVIEELDALDQTLTVQSNKTVDLKVEMDSILSKTVQTKRVSTSMLNLTETHSGSVQRLMDSMSLINRNTVALKKNIRDGAMRVDGLKRLGNDLRQGVSDLHLPDDTHGIDSEVNPSGTSAAREAANRAVSNG